MRLVCLTRIRVACSGRSAYHDWRLRHVGCGVERGELLTHLKDATTSTRWLVEALRGFIVCRGRRGSQIGVTNLMWSVTIRRLLLRSVFDGLSSPGSLD